MENESKKNPSTGTLVYCPVNCLDSYDCPYARKGGYCVCEQPWDNCDDFAMFFSSKQDYENS